MTSRDVAVARLGLAAPEVKVLRSFHFYMPAFFAGIAVTLVTLLGISMLKRVPTFVAEAQGHNFVHTVYSDVAGVPQLVSFTSTSKQLKVETGAEVPMYIARVRHTSFDEVDGVRMYHDVDTVLTLGLITTKEVDQGHRSIPLQEWLDNPGTLHASTGDVQ